MIDINPQLSKHDVSQKEYPRDEPESIIYVEKATNFLYEVKLFEDFAFIRLAIPDYQPAVQRIDLNTLAELFEEYSGDMKELRSLLFGSSASRIIIEKKGD